MASSSSLSATGAKKDNEGSPLTPPEAKKDNEASPKDEAAEESIGESKCESDTIASATSTNRTLILRSSDDKNFEIDELVALASQTLEDLLLTCGNDIIQLPNVSSEILELVIVFLKKHHNDECKTKEEMNEMLQWDEEFFKSFSYQMIFGMINASNYLNIKSLLDSACEEFAGRVKDMAVEELRALFDLKNDFTPEEEAKVRQENAWAFEK